MIPAFERGAMLPERTDFDPLPWDHVAYYNAMRHVPTAYLSDAYDRELKKRCRQIHRVRWPSAQWQRV